MHVNHVVYFFVADAEETSSVPSKTTAPKQDRKKTVATNHCMWVKDQWFIQDLS